jgi:P pilus assembly chaperone PapD
MFNKTLLTLALCAASMAASAGLSIERTTTIRDDFNGTAVIESAATIGEESGTRVAEATFTNFHPRGEQRFVSGDIARESVRDGELVTVTYDGSLSLSGMATNNGNLTISFVDLRIERGEESVNLAGSLVVNGQTIDAATAPAQVRAVLLGLLRFFKA